MPVSRLPLALAVVSCAAWAQNDPFARGIDSVPIKPTPALHSTFTLEGGELELHRSFALQALLDFNLGVLDLKLGNERLGDLIPFRADLHLMGAYQVHPRVEISADLPITFLQVSNFELLTNQGFPQESPHAAGLGAPRLLGRVQILRQSEWIQLLALAAVLEVRLPIGDKQAFLSDRGFVFAPRLAVEREFGPVRVLANLGWRLRTAPGQYLNLFVGQEFTFGVGGLLKLADAAAFRDNTLIADFNLATPAEAPFTFRDADSLKTPLELTVGARTTLGEHWQVQLALSKGLGAPGYGRELFRITLGLGWVHHALADRDGDGIPDVNDGCPDDPEDKDGYQDEDGCPEPGGEDRDHDGVPDQLDVCPDVPGTMQNGCPEPVLDRDGDGVPDAVDQCPDTPGPAALDGCPDRDGDQIADVVDKCPDEPGPPEREGCPPPEDEEEVVLESERIRINNQILFEFGSDRIDPASYKLLDEVAQVLTQNPDVGPVLIEGHTDNVGPRAFNLDLSKRRAKSVENYLTAKGIARERLRSDGFGFDRPIVPNDTPLNRAKNRRTEFKLVEENGTPSKPRP